MTPTDNWILGIDGGGTSTEAWLAKGVGEVVGRGRAGASNAKAVGTASARKSLEQAITEAFAEAGVPRATVAAACFGLAGLDHPDDRESVNDWANQMRWARQVVLVNDGDLLIAAGTPEGWGSGVIAGTGSIAVGRSPSDSSARAGGWGHLFGDEGSAYYVTLAAFRQVARRTDGRDPRREGSDPLAEALCRALSVPDPERMVSALYAPEFDRTRIASLAPAVIEAAKHDPSVAETLLRPAGEALAEQAAAAARGLGIHSGPLPVAMAGGFLLSSEIISAALLDGLTRRGYNVTAKAVPDPVEGAIVIAERARAGR